MKTYFLHKTSVNKLFFELDEKTKGVTAYTMHCDPALTGTMTEKNHKGIWVEFSQICDAEMTVFLSSAKYDKLTCTQSEAFDYQNERREQKIKEILAEYNEQKLK